MDNAIPTHHPTRKRPSRIWYAIAALVLLSSTALFVAVLVNKARALHDRIEPLPRFVGPTEPAGFVITVDEPGKQNIFYENLGTLGDRVFDTPRRQVWTTFDAPAMTCTVTHIESGQVAQVRMPGTAESPDKREITKDLIVAYDFNDRQGHSAWVFEAERAGNYRIVIDYDQAVYQKPSDIVIPPELTKAKKRTMNRTEGAAYEEARRDLIEQAALAELEPIDVLFAVGPDPTVGSFFEVIGLKGAATVLAFGFTFAALTSLVTLMLRGGHVTPRGDIEHVQRLGQ